MILSVDAGSFAANTDSDSFDLMSAQFGNLLVDSSDPSVNTFSQLLSFSPTVGSDFSDLTEDLSVLVNVNTFELFECSDSVLVSTTNHNWSENYSLNVNSSSVRNSSRSTGLNAVAGLLSWKISFLFLTSSGGG